LVQALADRGHHLTILTVDPMNSNHPNITEILMEDSYEININFVESRGLGKLKLSYEMVMNMILRVDEQLSQPKVQDLIVNHKNYNFDLLIVEYLFVTPMIAFAELYQIPTIGESHDEITSVVLV
jgi:glucuronosyltransferase